MIAFLGTGLLGGNFVRALIRRGETVYVWNRTAEKAKALEADGAKAFTDPAEAVKGASRVHLCLSDDAAVDAVLEQAKPGLSSDTILVDHTTTSAPGAVARVSRWDEAGIPFQHAPVFMAPANALAATGIMMASGDEARFERLRPHLEAMTGKLVYLGPDPSRAAAIKLMGNLFLMCLTAGVADVFALAKGLGVPADVVPSLFDVFNPAGMVQPRAMRMLKGAFNEPSWELGMARKDARLMMEAAGDGGLSVLPGIVALMDRWIAKGHSADDWTVIAKDSV